MITFRKKLPTWAEANKILKLHVADIAEVTPTEHMRRNRKLNTTT